MNSFSVCCCSVRARRELSWLSSEAVAPLVEGLRGLGSRENFDIVVIEHLAAALVELYAASGPLAELVTPDPAGTIDVKVRLAAMRALANFDEPVVQSALVACLLEDPDWQVRGTAAELLRKRAAEPAVKRALHDTSIARADRPARNRLGHRVCQRWKCKHLFGQSARASRRPRLEYPPHG